MTVSTRCSLFEEKTLLLIRRPPCLRVRGRFKYEACLSHRVVSDDNLSMHVPFFPPCAIFAWTYTAGIYRKESGGGAPGRHDGYVRDTCPDLRLGVACCRIYKAYVAA